MPLITLLSRAGLTSVELLQVIAEGEPEEFVGNVESFLGEYAKDLLPMPDDMTGELRRLHWRVRRPPAQLARLSAALAPAARWATTQTTATTAGRERPRTLPGPTLGVWGPSRAERTRPPIPSLRNAEADLRTRWLDRLVAIHVRAGSAAPDLQSQTEAMVANGMDPMAAARLGSDSKRRSPHKPCTRRATWKSWLTSRAWRSPAVARASSRRCAVR